LAVETAQGVTIMNAHDEKLRDEIIESQKTVADFVKWKLISVAAVAAVALGFRSTTPTPDSAKLLMCLVPLICIYIDLNSMHIMMRVLTIGIYLKTSCNPYEHFVFQLRDELKRTNPFTFELMALYGSSLLINFIILLLGLALRLDLSQLSSRPLVYSAAAVIGVTVIIFVLYRVLFHWVLALIAAGVLAILEIYLLSQVFSKKIWEHGAAYEVFAIMGMIMTFLLWAAYERRSKKVSQVAAKMAPTMTPCTQGQPNS